MLLKNSQFIIEILLMVVLIAGIVSSRLIVWRLGVIRDSYTALNEMVATLDASTEQMNHMFERVRHEVTQGDRRLSVLLERARNAEEDLMDQQKMTQETADSLSGVLERSEKQEAGLNQAVESARAMLQQLEMQKKALEQSRAAAGPAPAEGDSAPHFSDEIVMPVPGRLRSPRPYMRQNEADG